MASNLCNRKPKTKRAESKKSMKCLNQFDGLECIGIEIEMIHSKTTIESCMLRIYGHTYACWCFLVFIRVCFERPIGFIKKKKMGRKKIMQILFPLILIANPENTCRTLTNQYIFVCNRKQKQKGKHKANVQRHFQISVHMEICS